MKVALISETLPPSKTGQGIVLARMLELKDASEYCLISVNPREKDPADSTTSAAANNYHQLAARFAYNQGYGSGVSPSREAVTIPLAVLERAWQLSKILRQQKCEAVVACTGDLLDLPAAFLAARYLKLPFYAYLFDHYSHREWIFPAKRFWAKRFESVIMRKATGVVVPNEVLGEDLRKRFGIDVHVIHNSFDLSRYEAYEAYEALPDDRTGGDDEIKIVYTGDIYEAHYDAFLTLIQAIEQLRNPAIKLHLYTGQSPTALAERQIKGPVVVHPPRPPEEIPLIQHQATLLYLPLAFESPYPELVRTSSTTKLGEYLGARRPVIAHAPADSFVSWYFQTHDCGLVVSSRDPALMAQAIERVLTDRDLAQQLSARAWQRAQEDFDIQTARSRFWSLVSGATSETKVRDGQQDR